MESHAASTAQVISHKATALVLEIGRRRRASTCHIMRLVLNDGILPVAPSGAAPTALDRKHLERHETQVSHPDPVNNHAFPAVSRLAPRPRGRVPWTTRSGGYPSQIPMVATSMVSRYMNSRLSYRMSSDCAMWTEVCLASPSLAAGLERRDGR